MSTNNTQEFPRLPFLTVVIGTISRLDAIVASARPENVTFRAIRGHRTPAKIALLRETAAALQFPSYFGENLDALEECLADFGIPESRRTVVILTNADKALEGRDDDFKAYLAIWKDVLKERSERDPSTTKAPILEFCLHSEEKNKEAITLRLQQIGLDAVQCQSLE